MTDKESMRDDWGHPAANHGNEKQLGYGPSEGCQTGVYIGRGFGRRLVVCLCLTSQEDIF